MGTAHARTHALTEIHPCVCWQAGNAAFGAPCLGCNRLAQRCIAATAAAAASAAARRPAPAPTAVSPPLPPPRLLRPPLRAPVSLSLQPHPSANLARSGCIAIAATLPAAPPPSPAAPPGCRCVLCCRRRRRPPRRRRRHRTCCSSRPRTRRSRCPLVRRRRCPPTRRHCHPPTRRRRCHSMSRQSARPCSPFTCSADSQACICDLRMRHTSVSEPVRMCAVLSRACV